MQVSEDALNILFRNARTANGFTSQAVDPGLLRRAYELAALAPTSMNAQPTRYVFITTPEAKARLLPAMSPGNMEKTSAAPVTVIVATDTRFFEHMPDIWHGKDAKANFEANPTGAQALAARNGTLGGAYFILAARAVGLDCGPMSGVNLAKLDEEFFPDGRFKSNFVINLGYADHSKTFARNPRLPFETACTVL